MVLKKIKIPSKCVHCRVDGHVHYACKSRRTYYRCTRCNKQWDNGIAPSKMKQIKFHDNATFMGVFFGLWSDEEVRCIQGIFGGLIYKHALNEEWSFFKGRHLLSAWRSTSEVGTVYFATDLAELMQKVKDRCLQNLLL